MTSATAELLTGRVGDLFRRRSMEEFQRDVIESGIPHVDITLKLEIRKGKVTRLVRVIESGELINFD